MLVHDWPQDALGQAIPYGIYDMTRNHGYVVIGDCFDTPRFAVEAISDWWWQEGFDRAQRLIAGTTTAAGLTVTACLKRGGNEQGEAVSDADMPRLLLSKHAICPQWNYTLSPRLEAEQMAQ